MRAITRRNFVASGLAAAAAVALAACSTTQPATDSGSSDSSSASDSGSLKMEAILISSASQVTAAQGNAMAAYAEERGVDFSVYYYEQVISKEADLIENAVQAGVDVLIVHNQSEGDCVDQINAAVDAGVTVLLYATDVPDAKYTLLYTEDSYSAGQKEGEMAAAWAQENLVDKGKDVICAMGTYSVTPIAVDRGLGAQDKLLELIPDATIVGTYEMAYKEEGLEVGENLLQSNPDVNLVLGINDQSACGVMEAFEAGGKTADEVAMFGIDGTDEGMYYIATGTMFRGTVAIPTNEVGCDLVQAGIDLQSDPDKYPAGGQTVINWESTPIDASNVDEYKDIWGYLADDATEE